MRKSAAAKKHVLDKRLPLGQGHLTTPLIAQFTARQYLLEAIQDRHGHVIITDLRADVYPKYCLRRGRRVASLHEWATRHHLTDHSGVPLEWVESCADHTLYQWALDGGLEWAERIPGRPGLTAKKFGWAHCNGLPAFEMWFKYDVDANPIVAKLAELPDTSSYDWLVILPDHSLAGLDQHGYTRINVDLSDFDSLLRKSFGPFSFDPLNETVAAARTRIKKEFNRELSSFLILSARTLADRQGHLEPTHRKHPEHFDWVADGIVDDLRLADLSERFRRDINTIASGVSEVRRLIGLDRPVGRPSGIKEKLRRRSRD